MSNSIAPVNLVIKSLRDNGYKNTAYAIAELIDNSVQHNSSEIDLICLENDQIIGAKTLSRIFEIAVLDNGSGMSCEILNKALQFGNGTNLEQKNQTGIGKFGMGLPSSSISQGQKVEVWTWQNGIESAIYSYLDVNDIISGDLTEIPEPITRDIPKKWLKSSKNFSNSGTLVVWSKLDRCLWKTGKTIIDHSEFIVGRMYRKFIYSGQCKINAYVVKENNTSKRIYEKSFQANDPLYLMENTSVNSVLTNGLPKPMFEKLGGEDGYEKTYTIDYNGAKHSVYIRYSIASEACRKGVNPGAKPHGKHAGKNIGVSVLRAGRELDLDSSWAIGYDPRERWWGAEIEFPPALDEVFGVTNNKQYANNFKELGVLDINQMLKERSQSVHEYKEELMEENDPKLYLIGIAIDLENQIKGMRALIKAQAAKLEKRETSERHKLNGEDAEKHATEITKSREEEGHKGKSELDAEGKTEEEKVDEVKEELESNDVPEAEDFARQIVNSSNIYKFVETRLETRAFFSVSPVGGKIIVKLNTDHPAYNQFVEVLTDYVEPECSLEDLSQRLQTAKNGMKLLLMAWARYEDEQPDGRRKEAIQDARTDWGRMASEFMRNDE